MTVTSAFSGSSTTNVTQLAPGGRRLTLSEPALEWWEDVNLRLQELSALPTGWDGYKGRAMRFEVGCFVKEILKICGGSIKLKPQIVPGPDGDVQIEWHYNNQSIELNIRAQYDVVAWRRNDATDEDGEEIPLVADFTIVDQWLKDFNRAMSTNAAAAA